PPIPGSRRDGAATGPAPDPTANHRTAPTSDRRGATPVDRVRRCRTPFAHTRKGGPVLSFDTTHAITGCLLHAETDAHLHACGAPPVLLVLHDQPYPPGPSQLRTMQALSF